MNTLEKFIGILCGEFNNDEQVLKEKEEGKIVHPKAKHINSVCNEKIINLPESFEGYFVIEESYYDTGKAKNILPHLFLFTLNENNNVVLSSYELPEGVSKEEFRNDNKDLVIDYNKLLKSEKFTPMEYKEINDEFVGESLSTFGPGITFELKESMKKGELHVSEVFKRNGTITFGFVDPIIYKEVWYMKISLWVKNQFIADFFVLNVKFMNNNRIL